jgi:hypothetical protein
MVTGTPIIFAKALIWGGRADAVIVQGDDVHALALEERSVGRDLGDGGGLADPGGADDGPDAALGRFGQGVSGSGLLEGFGVDAWAPRHVRDQALELGDLLEQRLLMHVLGGPRIANEATECAKLRLDRLHRLGDLGRRLGSRNDRCSGRRLAGGLGRAVAFVDGCGDRQQALAAWTLDGLGRDD